MTALLGVSAARADDNPGRIYARELQRGRNLEAKGDHAGALQAYDRALAARPDDAAVLSEVSVSALATGDLERARAAATQAASHGETDRLRAAAYYNLGRVEEKAKRLDKAVDAYRSAMGVCPNPVVRKQLVKLAPKLADEVDSVATTRLEGPSPTLAKAAAEKRCAAVDDGKLDEAKTDAPARGPFLAVQTLHCDAAEGSENKLGDLGIALRLKKGWYLLPHAVEMDSVASENSGKFDLTHDWPGWGPVADWRSEAHHHHVSHSGEGSEIESYDNSWLIACAVDRGGEPFCAGPTQVEAAEYQATRTDEDDDKASVQLDKRWALDVKYVAGGIELSGTGECAVLPGKHPVKLP
jgi:tetratricopeptide (TPR) repeat protein